MKRLMMLSVVATVLGVLGFADRALAAAAEGDFVLQSNVWWERMDRIYSTNYHVGQMLPVGTKVTVISTKRSRIIFKTEGGDVYTIAFNRKHDPIGFDAYFDRYFGSDDPLKGFSKKEQEQIKGGRLEVGMSKEAVTASYGYPPSHRTPSLDGDSWIYWINRFRSISVLFSDGKVSAFPNGRP